MCFECKFSECGNMKMWKCEKLSIERFEIINESKVMFINFEICLAEII
jgi:hypothetical protein